MWAAVMCGLGLGSVLGLTLEIAMRMDVLEKRTNKLRVDMETMKDIIRTCSVHSKTETKAAEDKTIIP